MSEQRDEKLNDIVPGWGDRIRALLGGEKEKLDASGAKHKALGPQVTRQDIVDVAALAIEMAATKAKSLEDGEQVNMKDAIGEALDELMEVPTVSVETAQAILAVEDEPADEQPAEDTEHEHGEREPSELEKALSSLVAFNEQLVTEQKALVDAMPQIEALATGFKALGAFTAEVEALRGEVADLQDEFKHRPRASQAAETIPAADDVRAKKATTEPAKTAFNYPTKE